MKALTHNPRSGQALLLTVACLSIMLIGSLGLALDGAQLYAQQQMAQTAADAATEAGIMSLFDGTNTTAAHPFGTGSPPSSFTCTTSDLRTPCVYARNNGFGGSAADTVTVSFPASESGVTLSSDPVPAIRVTVQRSINATLIRFVSAAASTVNVAAEAAIVGTVSRVPLLITHPSAANVLSGGSVSVCGGPNRSIQINSNSSTAASSAGSVDLSHAGPADSGNCVAGTGGDFAVFGGPAAAPNGMALGTSGRYLQPASPILDPYSGVAAPSAPAAAPAKIPLANGVSGCPAAPKKPCRLYSPGLYVTGISVKNETAVFKPGLYYISSGGFGNAANGEMYMATGFAADAATGAGMVVYNTGGGTFSTGANADATLVGSDNTSTYKGILFFQDRNAAAATHSLGGGGSITLTGSLYITNTLALMKADATRYQTLSLGGNSSIQINGLIVVGKLSTGGASTVRFNLAGTPTLQVRQIGLVR